MRKILSSLLMISAFFGLTSCDLDMYGDYSFSQVVVYYNFSGEDDEIQERQEPITNYFSENIDFDTVLTFEGSYSDAHSYGLQLFYENLSKLDTETVLGMLEGDEIVQYYVTMKSNKVSEVLAVATWQNSDDDEDTEDEEDTEDGEDSGDNEDSDGDSAEEE